MRLNGKMKKLQTAMVKKGIVIKIHTNQFLSVEQKRMITSYRICTPISYFSERYKEWRVKDYEILNTCSMPDVIFCLRDIYKAVGEW